MAAVSRQLLAAALPGIDVDASRAVPARARAAARNHGADVRLLAQSLSTAIGHNRTWRSGGGLTGKRTSRSIAVPHGLFRLDTMSTGSGSTLDETLPGIQLAVFETLWAAEPRLNRIAFLSDENRLDIFFEWGTEPSEEDREGAEYLMQEVLDVAFEGAQRRACFDSGQVAPSDYRDLMTPAIFRAIASAHAPWRLEQGH